MGDTTLVGLTGFGPNINIVRDPRFGRNSELPSEDPFLAGNYAVQSVLGMQVGGREGRRTGGTQESIEGAGLLKMIAGLKHFALYSVEDNRHSRNFNVSDFDLWDTYLPQYRLGFSKQHGLFTYLSLVTPSFDVSLFVRVHFYFIGRAGPYL